MERGQVCVQIADGAVELADDGDRFDVSKRSLNGVFGGKSEGFFR